MDERHVKKYMREQLRTNAEDFDVFDCGEVNSTKLAEDAAQVLDLYVGDEIPEAVFEIALEVSEEQNWFDRE